jgi:TolB-like protein
MEKGILFIFVLLCVANTICSQSKQRIAVYVTGGKTDGDNNVLTAKLKSAITDSRNYEAVERTVEFLQQLRKEQKYQRSGNVDDSDIARMGKESGVQYVCVAELMPVQGGDFVTARLIDVEKASVVASADGADKISDLPSLMRMSESIAGQLIQNASCRYTGITKKRVAVYVSGVDKEGANKVLGVKLVSAVTKSNNYAAMERTDAFLRQLGKEQNYQRSGNVNDNQLAQLGKQFGVQYVCAAKVSESSYGGKFLDVSLIDVETAVVIATANDALINSDMAVLMSVTQNIASQLLNNAWNAGIKQVDEIPEWFLNPQDNQYVGVSLPVENQDIAIQQAVYVALINYMLQRDCEGKFQYNYMSTHEDDEDDIFNTPFTSTYDIALLLPVGYEVVQIAKNKYGEVFIALRVPENAASKISMIAKQHKERKNLDYIDRLEIRFVNDIYDFYFEKEEVGDDLKVAASMKPENLYYKRSNQTTYIYETTCHIVGQVLPNNEVSLPAADVMHSLEQSLGMAYLMALLDIFRNVSTKSAAFGSFDGKVGSVLSSVKNHSTTFINEIYIEDNILCINYTNPNLSEKK